MRRNITPALVMCSHIAAIIALALALGLSAGGNMPALAHHGAAWEPGHPATGLNPNAHGAPFPYASGVGPPAPPPVAGSPSASPPEETSPPVPPTRQASPPSRPPGEEVHVSVSPSDATVRAGEALDLDSIVAGSPDSSVVWELEPPSTGETLLETFPWQGDHGAVLGAGGANTVWWDADTWDTRTDSAHNAVSADGDGNHIDVHHSNTDLTSAARVNDRMVLGGDGTPGVGVMHLDFEGIASARLRNPMLISAEKPGVVEFRAPSFVTTGHWWEVAISPADEVTGGDFTAVPSTSDDFAGLQGSGHYPPEDSINFLVLGRNDVPCKTAWELRTGVTKAVRYSTQEHLGPVLPISPSEKDKLYHWRLEYYPDRVALHGDLDEDGALEHLYDYPVSVPWSEVYVQLLGVAYQATKHPQDGDCGAYQGQVRELGWKEVRIGPLKYAMTRAFPRDGGADRLPQDTGWVGYDLRDTQRTGVSAGLNQPNIEAYSKHFSMGFCSDEEVYGCEEAVSEKRLTFELPPGSAVGIARALLLYDIRRDGDATLEVNGQEVGPMPRSTTVPAAAWEQWPRRSIDIDPELLVEGENTITIKVDGDVQMDRLQVELAYAPPPSGRDLGSIDEDGTYQAPDQVPSPLTVRVKAASADRPYRWGTATLTLLPGPGTSSVTPDPTPAMPAPPQAEASDAPDPTPQPDARAASSRLTGVLALLRLWWWLPLALLFLLEGCLAYLARRLRSQV